MKMSTNGIMQGDKQNFDVISKAQSLSADVSYTNHIRNIVGYGLNPPNPRWPNGAKIAVSFVVNYEEGAQSTLLNGDNYTECRLTEICTTTEQVENERILNAESLYDYGSRCGFWRLLNLFKKHNMVATAFACALALKLNPQAGKAMLDAGWEIASHGYRWINYANVDIETEREHLKKCTEIHKEILNERPLGFYQGKPSVNTRALVMEEGGYVYVNDSYADDLPYWDMQSYNDYDHISFNKNKTPLLTIPYTLSVNDIKFVTPPGYENGESFYQHLKDTFDYLYEEGKNGFAKMMSIGLHGRLAGQPGRAMGLHRFMEYIKSKDDVWVCKRIEIAEHWKKNFPPHNI
ncbi:MAG: allantoinase PuuE [Alphaproteobacteria bacterium]|nr:allantoinase PuuE [Alphaproteobacteria bacterium]